MQDGKAVLSDISERTVTGVGVIEKIGLMENKILVRQP